MQIEYPSGNRLPKLHGAKCLLLYYNMPILAARLARSSKRFLAEAGTAKLMVS
ncbi:hypothetical protein [Pseudoduganella buxea]|uniref:Uncharacterized protein n=1 Tax=Pseudoduganella buxea TaxID=1949069 RepID=A0A6I3STV7_9BURK|nr:hypothetical protein [Pseudoduganella buxea]MTV52484.1 hypothetical protein [Pseudoduganella buxea]